MRKNIQISENSIDIPAGMKYNAYNSYMYIYRLTLEVCSENHSLLRRFKYIWL